MIRCKADRNDSSEKVFIEARGDIVEIANDICVITCEIYNQIAKEYPDTAKSFKELLQLGFSDNSTVWENPDGVRGDVKGGDHR